MSSIENLMNTITRPNGTKVKVSAQINIRRFMSFSIDDFYLESGWYIFWSEDATLSCAAYICDKKFIGCEFVKTYYCELDGAYYHSKEDIEKIAKLKGFV